MNESISSAGNFNVRVQGGGSDKDRLNTRTDFYFERMKDSPSKVEFMDWVYNMELFLETRSNWTDAAAVLGNFKFMTEPVGEAEYDQAIEEVIDEWDPEDDECDKAPWEGQFKATSTEICQFLIPPLIPNWPGSLN